MRYSVETAAFRKVFDPKIVLDVGLETRVLARGFGVGSQDATGSTQIFKKIF